MNEAKHLTGEQMEKARRRRRSAIFASLFVVGLLSGIYMGHQLASDGFDLSTPWSPTISLIIAAAYLAAMIVGSIALSRQMDEVEKQINYQAGASAGGVYMLLYPLWFFLWKGGFVPEPIHWVLFIVFWLALMVSTLYYRFR